MLRVIVGSGCFSGKMPFGSEIFPKIECLSGERLLAGKTGIGYIGVGLSAVALRNIRFASPKTVIGRCART